MKDLQPPEPYNSWALKFYGLLTETLEHLISFCGSVRLQWCFFFWLFNNRCIYSISPQLCIVNAAKKQFDASTHFKPKPKFAS